MFLDRHDIPGATPEELAAAHLQDVEVQDDFGVRYHTYWFDPEKGSVFCLAEGPSREALEDVHRVAHGQLASVIIELDPNAPLNAMLGSIPTHPAGTAYTAPAMRAIVFTDICGSVAQTYELGDDGHMALLRDHDTIVRSALEEHAGREVKHTGDGIMAAFTSAVAAVAFSIAVQRALDDRNRSTDRQLQVSIGVNAGEPVTGENDDLFGAAVQIAARLCAAAMPGEITTSVVVRELCAGKSFQFEHRGEVPLKGVPEPTPTYAVVWR